MRKYKPLQNIHKLIDVFGQTTLSTYHDNVNRNHESYQGSNYKAYQAYVELLTNEMAKFGYTKTDNNESPEDIPVWLGASKEDRKRDAMMKAGYKQYKFTGQPNTVFSNGKDSKYVEHGETMTEAVFEDIKEKVRTKISNECSADQCNDSDFDDNPGLIQQFINSIRLAAARLYRSIRSKPMNDLVQHIINEDKAIQDKNRPKMIVEDPGNVLRAVSERDNVQEKLKEFTEPPETHNDPTDPLVETITTKTASTKSASKNFESRRKSKGTDDRGDSNRDNDNLRA